MINRRVCDEPRSAKRGFTQAVAALCLILAATPLWAQTPIPVSLGAGLRTSFAHTAPDAGASTDQFFVDSARLYISGSAAEKVKFMFNTEYDGATSKIGVMDAAAKIEVSPAFNIWAGRFLPPSDRANLYGPYYSHHWAVYSDGIQDGYPFVAVGRDNGAVYWGDFGKVKASVGAFDGLSATGNPKLLGAGRIQIDFWDPEGGYYLNGTYYGGKNLLAIGGASQVQSGKTASSFDFLMERKLPDGGVISIESEYATYNGLGGYDSHYGASRGAYGLASYLFPKEVGAGKFEVLGKFAEARFLKGATASDGDFRQKTTEFNFNYVMKEFNSRVMFFFKNTDYSAVKTDLWQTGIGLQIQM